MFKRLFKNRGFAIQLAASLAFILLTIYAWGQPVKDVLYYLWLLIVCLAIIIASAFAVGYLLHKVLRRRK